MRRSNNRRFTDLSGSPGRWLARLAALAAVVALIAVGLRSDRRVAESATFGPEADAFVDASKPTSNYGKVTGLKVDASPVRTVYMRFNVSGAGGDPSAVLRVYADSASNLGFDVRTVASNSWGETSITYSNAPASGPVIASTGSVVAGRWYSFDVSSAVTGNGLVSFAITSADTTAITLASRESAHPAQLIVPAPPSPSPYLVTRSGSTYTARSQTNGTTFTGTLKFAVESAVGDLGAYGGGTVTFSAGTFDFGTGYFKFYDITNIVFEGQGMDVTIIQNSSDAGTDTEPFNCTNCDRLTIRDLTVKAGGAPRTTSDALDFDRGDGNVVERVKVSVSRARGIIFDGKDAGATATGNAVRGCVIEDIPGNGVELLASGTNIIEGCTITNVGRHGIQIAKSSTVADQPNKKSNDNVVRNNTISGAAQDGINITSSDNNELVGNGIAASGRDGIRITSANSVTCNGNKLDANAVSGSSGWGASITSSLCHDNVVCSSNTFASNGSGSVQELGTDTAYSSCGSVTPPTATSTATPTAAITPADTPTPTSTPAGGSTLTLVPVADAYVSDANPTSNYGSSASLRVDASPVVHSYLRFDVPSGGAIASAKLRVWATSSQSTGYEVHGVDDNTWTESAIMFSSAPAYNAASAGSSGPVASNTWTEVDVTSIVQGSGPLSLMLLTTHTTALAMSSREAGANAPQLIITTAAGP